MIQKEIWWNGGRSGNLRENGDVCFCWGVREGRGKGEGIEVSPQRKLIEIPNLRWKTWAKMQWSSLWERISMDIWQIRRKKEFHRRGLGVGYMGGMGSEGFLLWGLLVSKISSRNSYLSRLLNCILRILFLWSERYLHRKMPANQKKYIRGHGDARPFSQLAEVSAG